MMTEEDCVGVGSDMLEEPAAFAVTSEAPRIWHKSFGRITDVFTSSDDIPEIAEKQWKAQFGKESSHNYFGENYADRA